MKTVLASAAEAELGALFINGRAAIHLRYILTSIAHIEPPTPIKTDNTTALGIIKDTVKQKRSKSIDMRYYWIQDKNEDNTFHIFWKPGIQNLGDYFTKHHSPSHHKQMRKHYILSATKQSGMRGCVDTQISTQKDICTIPGISLHTSLLFPYYD